ncbi:hypothetical protein HK096_009967, partial [Nowakowskiella sp. JEL0078]
MRSRFSSFDIPNSTANQTDSNLNKYQEDIHGEERYKDERDEIHQRGQNLTRGREMKENNQKNSRDKIDPDSDFELHKNCHKPLVHVRNTPQPNNPKKVRFPRIPQNLDANVKFFNSNGEEIPYEEMIKTMVKKPEMLLLANGRKAYVYNAIHNINDHLLKNSIFSSDLNDNWLRLNICVGQIMK